MFGISTNETLPDKIVHSYEAWDEYMSEVWKSLIQPMGLNKKSVVIEIAPGTSTKIALALRRLDFCGTLWIVEPAAEIASEIVAKAQAILPEANIRLVMQYLVDAIHELPKNIDLIVANHVLDDMLIAQGTSNPDIKKELFEWTTDRKGTLEEVFRQSWEIMMASQYTIHQAQQSVYDDLLSAFTVLSPQHVIFNQYASLVLNYHQMQSLNHCAQEILQCLKKQYLGRSMEDEFLQRTLNEHKNYNDAQIGNEVLNAKNWMVLVNDCGYK